MLKTLLGKPLDSVAHKESSSGSSPQRKIDLDRIKTLIKFFPIGKKLSYYPEFKKEIVFETFVVAYCIDGDFVYSGEAIDRDSEGYPTGFRVGEDGKPMPVSGIKLLQLLVPDTSDLELKLDYQRRALIGRGRQFKKGNYISLISSMGGKGLTTVDTEVAKQIVIKDGPYAQTQMILLTPELQTLNFTDQRRKTRAKTCVPVMVSLPKGKLSGPCTILDISDGAVRIRLRDHDTRMHVMHRGDEVILEIDLGEAERHYTIKGLVFRYSPETCIIRLEQMLKDGRFISFGPLDHLELKTVLFNYGS